jgi:hypothetical protein
MRMSCSLAIDIGGTRFTGALFEGDRLARREARSTDCDGEPEAMLA